jgi:hypothetical protein
MPWIRSEAVLPGSRRQLKPGPQRGRDQRTFLGSERQSQFAER